MVSIELPEYLTVAIRKIAVEQGFNEGKFSIRFDIGSNVGDGFVAAIYKAIVQEGDRELILLCKLPPLNEARRREFGSMPLFKREAFIYKELLPAFYEFQKEKGIAEDAGFFNAPKCYLAHFDEEKDEALIVMEDLREQGYKMYNKYNPVDFEHVKLLVTQLGRLHAISLAMKEQKPEMFAKFQQLTDIMNDMMTTNEGFAMMIELSFDRALTTLQPHEDFKREKILKLRENFASELKLCTDMAKAEPFTVVGHGDCWVNNFMYSYENGSPNRIVLLDWQITRYASPVLDLLYFMMICTDEKLRADKYDAILQIYHKSLREHLELLGGTPAIQFPFTALLRHLKAYGKFGFIMSLFVLPIICTPNEELIDMDAAAEKFAEDKNYSGDFFAVTDKAAEKYRIRMSGVIRDAIRLGYL